MDSIYVVSIVKGSKMVKLDKEITLSVDEF